jgi:hypothetical protein
VELAKFQVLDVAPSFTMLALKPPIPPDTHTYGSFVTKILARLSCALSDPAENTTLKNAKKKRLIIMLQVVLRFARGVG